MSPDSRQPSHGFHPSLTSVITGAPGKAAAGYAMHRIAFSRRNFANGAGPEVGNWPSSAGLRASRLSVPLD
jgi:hypothetical protein